jgi:hypothetical protein
MPSSNVLVTAEMMSSVASVTRPRLTADISPVGSSRLLNWVVQMTERAERLLARGAEADAHLYRMVIDGKSQFASDAAGGGSRAIEAARSLRAQADRQ